MSARGSGAAFTLVEVLIALALSALLFTAALNLLLGIVTAWERAREGDLEADAEYRLFAFLRHYLETATVDGEGEGDVRLENLPGERGEQYLVFPARNSPLLSPLAAEWRTERFALVPESDGIRLLPFVDDEERDRPRLDEGLLLFGEEAELAYWIFDEDRGRWEEEDRLETEGGADPGLPGYLILRFPEEDKTRWIKVGQGEGDLPLW